MKGRDIAGAVLTVAGVPGPGTVAEPPARGAVLLRLGVWLLASLVGAGAGIALAANVISMLR